MNRQNLSRWLAGAALAALVVGTLGCGNTIYILKVNSAEERFIQAKQMGAEQRAPYEYYGAQARLTESKRQAAEGEYGNAATLADEADALAEKAAEKCREAQKQEVSR